jgi:hypothetical protein
VHAAVVLRADRALRVMIRIAEQTGVVERPYSAGPEDIRAKLVARLRPFPAGRKKNFTETPMKSEKASFSAPDSFW